MMEKTQKTRFFKNAVIVAAITVLTVFAYYDVTGFSFINYDDHLYVTQNPYVQAGWTLKSLEWAFFTTHGFNWIPVTWFSHIGTTELFGMNPGRHHLVNIIVHTINALLIFFTLRTMSIPVFSSAFVSLAFAIHPMHVESVAWISERKDLVYAFFFFLSVYAYSAYVKKPGSLAYSITFLTFALALMSKPMAVTLPLVFIILDVWPLRTIRFDNTNAFPTKAILNSFAEKIPFFMFSALIGLITYTAQDTQGAVSKTLTLASRFENAVISYVKYIYMMFVPINLSTFYPYPQSISALEFIPALMVILIVSFLAIRFFSKAPYLFTGWFWFIVTLLPVIGLIQAGEQAIADRYTYVPFTGLFLIAAMPFDKYFNGSKVSKLLLIAAFSGLLLFYTYLTKKQAGYWSDSITLFQQSAKARPGNYIAYYNLGSAQNSKGLYKAAYESLNEAIRVKPRYALAYVGLGDSLNGLGKTDDAIHSFIDALFIDPKLSEAYNGIGIALAKSRDFKTNPQTVEFLKSTFDNDFTDNFSASLACFQKAVILKPDYGDAYVNMGNVLFFMGKHENAIESFKAAIQTRPYFPEAYNGIGVVLMEMGKYQESIAYFTQALSQNATSESAKRNLEIAKTLYLKAK